MRNRNTAFGGSIFRRAKLKRTCVNPMLYAKRRSNICLRNLPIGIFFFFCLSILQEFRLCVEGEGRHQVQDGGGHKAPGCRGKQGAESGHSGP